MKETKLKDKKKLLMIGAIAVSIIIISVVLVFVVFKKDQELSTETLESKLQKVGADFYENYYYTGLKDENQLDKLSLFKDNGIKVDLTNIKSFVTINQDLEKQLKKDKCDYDGTKLVIYPKDPYGQKDYTVKVELSCKK